MSKHRASLLKYASEPEVYFVSNTIFYFYPGIHRLRDSLRLKNLYNFSFRSLPTETDNDTFISVCNSASITWEKSWNIEISSISFFLNDTFTFIIRFELSLFVKLSNISVFGRGYRGYSSIISQESTLDISNSISLK